MVEQSTSHPAEPLGTVIVDPDDIIAAFKRNRRDETEQRSHVLRITPPFHGERETELFVSETHNYYPPGLEPKPLHLNPGLFVGDDEPYVLEQFKPPSYTAERTMFVDENDYRDEETGERLDFTDKMEDEFDEWWEVTNEVWEDLVRGSLRDEITLHQRTGEGTVSTTIEVEYR